MTTIFSELSQQWKEEILLTKKIHLDLLIQQADELIATFKIQSRLQQLDLDNAQNEATALGVKVALKLAFSKTIVSSIKNKTFVSVVFAVYGEQNRLLTSEQHPNGEDFLNRKIEQLQWLFDDNPNINWEMIVVDDGCPNDSGKMAKQILGNGHPNVKVAFLQEGIDNKHRATIPLQYTNDSRKGGSILYGMALAAEQKQEGNHIIVFTDADLSTHLGQTGLLIEPILEQGKKVAIASRRELNSFVIKKGLRNTRGKTFIYLWKRLLPQLNYIIDTQCGFKAFDARLIKEIVYNMKEKKFAFDIELLLKTELLYSNSIEKVAIAWIDSDAESTTGGSVYLDMLHSIAGFYRKYLDGDAEADLWANFIKSLDQEKWDKLLERMPPEIENAKPSLLGNKLVEVVQLENL